MSFPQLILVVVLEVSVDVTNQGAIAAYSEFVQNLHEAPVSLILDSVFNHVSPESIIPSDANAA